MTLQYGIADVANNNENAALAELWRLFCRLAARMTLGDSSSLPESAAQRLLDSVCFTLRAAGAELSSLKPGNGDELYRRGTQVLLAECARGKKLWCAARDKMSRLSTDSCRDTLREAGAFFARYDHLFAAQEIPADIDYQLCVPVRQECAGVYFVNEYLRHLAAENAVVNCFAAAPAQALLAAYSPGGMAVLNVCEPLLNNALGLVLADKQPLGLKMSAADIAAAIVELRSDGARRAAAENFCRSAGIKNIYACAYVRSAADMLGARADAVRRLGGGEGVFVQF